MHVDGGLFIAMTTGLYSSPEGILNEGGLYVQLPTGIVSRVSVAADSLVVLVGDKGSRWLGPQLGLPLRAVPHKVISGLPAGSSITRSWYGKMYLPPSDALVPSTGDVAAVTYDAYRLAELKRLSSSPAPSSVSTLRASVELSSVACSHDTDGNYVSGGVWCWAECYPTAGLSCGQAAQCVDPVTGYIVDGTAMCPNMDPCELECVPGWNDTATTPDLCAGHGVVMYMDGFHSYASEKGDVLCVNLFFVSWTLDSTVKMFFGCIGTLAFAVFCQYLGKFRNSSGSFSPVLGVALYCLHTTVKYLLMLITMTFNVELFCMVIVGLTIGYACFYASEGPPQASYEYKKADGGPIRQPMVPNVGGTCCE